MRKGARQQRDDSAMADDGGEKHSDNYRLRPAGDESPLTDCISSRSLKSVARNLRYRPKIRPQKPRFFGCSDLGAGGVEAAPGVLLATLPVAAG